MRIFLAILAIFYLPQSTHAISVDISNPIVSGSEITLDVVVNDLSTPNYLQGTIRKVGASKYFGFTKNHLGEWFNYVSSPDTDYIKSTFYYFQPTDGTWSGKITLKNDTDSPNYEGQGEYEIKLKRYTGNSSGSASDSNTLVVNLIDQTPTPSPTPTPTPKPTKTPRPSLIPISSISDDNLALVRGQSTSEPVTFAPDNIEDPPENEDLELTDDKDIDLSTYALSSPSPSPPALPSEPAPSRNVGILSIISGGLFLIAAAVYYINNKPS